MTYSNGLQIIQRKVKPINVTVIVTVKNSQGLSLIVDSSLKTTFLNYAKNVAKKL